MEKPCKRSAPKYMRNYHWSVGIFRSTRIYTNSKRKNVEMDFFLKALPFNLLCDAVVQFLAMGKTHICCRHVECRCLVPFCKAFIHTFRVIL